MLGALANSKMDRLFTKDQQNQDKQQLLKHQTTKFEISGHNICQ